MSAVHASGTFNLAKMFRRLMDTGDVDGDSGRYRSKADQEDHECLETIPAVTDPIHHTPRARFSAGI